MVLRDVRSGYDTNGNTFFKNGDTLRGDGWD